MSANATIQYFALQLLSFFLLLLHRIRRIYMCHYMASLFMLQIHAILPSKVLNMSKARLDK